MDDSMMPNAGQDDTQAMPMGAPMTEAPAAPEAMPEEAAAPAADEPAAM